jgi:WG containing repeat
MAAVPTAAAPVSAAPVSASPTSAAPASTPSAGPASEAAPVSPAAVATPDTVLPVNAPATGAATALSAPTMMHPLVRPKTLADVTSAEAVAPATEPDAPATEETPEAEAEPKTPDPEQELSAMEWRFHHETLRELVDDPELLRELRDRLTQKLTPAQDNPTRARLLSLRAVVSRILGDLSKALSDAKMALMHAEATGELRRVAIAQARLAHVLQWRGDFAEADQLFAEANSTELPDRLRATMHEHAGKSCYDQGRYIEACNHFEKALELRKVEDPDLMARTELALDAVFRKVAENGWGPYPRTRDEILRVHKPPVPKFDEKKQCWGYVDPSGTTGINAAFADVQPFRDGVAWVRRPEAETWELIDEGGIKLIDASAGWLGVGSFSEGLAWVSRDGHSAWVAIDKKNRVVIPGGFDDVRPFRRGVAAVRRGGWGAVDKTGRIVVPCQFAGFATALTDGRYVDGFTDEGLAIVDNGGRKGVVDKSGKMVVAPVHPALVIHPVAFLVASPSGSWGALDRQGRPLIDPELSSRTAVIEELDRLMSDTKPVL